MTCIAMYFGCTYYPHFPSALDIGAGAPKELKIEGPLLRPVEPVETNAADGVQTWWKIIPENATG